MYQNSTNMNKNTIHANNKLNQLIHMLAANVTKHTKCESLLNNLLNLASNVLHNWLIMVAAR